MKRREEQNDPLPALAWISIYFFFLVSFVTVVSTFTHSDAMVYVFQFCANFGEFVQRMVTP